MRNNGGFEDTRQQVGERVIGRDYWRGIAFVGGLVAAVMLGAAPADAQQPAPAVEIPASPAMLRGFMIQNVCLDARGAVVEGVSPIDDNPRCVAERNLRPGENLPYHKDDHPSPWDKASAPQGYQRHDSFPVRTAEFGTVVEHSYDFGVGDGRRFGVFDAGKGDGGDITLLQSNEASYAATEDGGAGFQLFVGPHCQGPVNAAGLEDSWLIARLGGDREAPLLGQAVAHLDDLRQGRQSICPARLNAAFTRWYVEPVRYRAAPGQGTPITLTTLISEHYGGADPGSADHVERFYFTRELGSTRWERWQNVSRSHGFTPAQVAAMAARFAASGRCSKAPVPAGGAPLALIDCREWTLIVPPQNPSGDPPGFFIKAIRARHLADGLFAAPETQR
jgi:hypothetical protein